MRSWLLVTSVMLMAIKTSVFGANYVKAKKQKHPGHWQKTTLAQFFRLPLYFLIALLWILGSLVLARVPSSINLSSQLPIHNLTSLAVVTDPASLIEQGKVLYNSGNFTKAVELLQQAVKVYKQQGESIRLAATLVQAQLNYLGILIEDQRTYMLIGNWL
ncbi:MAG: hypothetical protein RMZ43_004745 [Nostoc sp. CmiVER01]|uniref:hypothetical protein n=1 Tax=Nostoc sp. CmiVER01 TaxID=3075384 RepID=UPI002AD4CB14|nr:hypothetical protein [Nostoc sp. CmiVER01]MDZ8124405.1 hypothetical protein [Nostoc sp. CmiVER01]